MPKAVWNAKVIADSDDVEVIEGYTYFPADAVEQQYLRPSDHRSVCPWKGTASYYDVVVDGAVNPAAAWCYPKPSRRAAPLVGGRIAFWRGATIEGDSDDSQGAGLLARIRRRR